MSHLIKYSQNILSLRAEYIHTESNTAYIYDPGCACRRLFERNMILFGIHMFLVACICTCILYIIISSFQFLQKCVRMRLIYRFLVHISVYMSHYPDPGSVRIHMRMRIRMLKPSHTHSRIRFAILIEESSSSTIKDAVFCGISGSSGGAISMQNLFLVDIARSNFINIRNQATQSIRVAARSMASLRLGRVAPSRSLGRLQLLL